MIDIRSDTVTKPTKGMRRAISEAEVGDDGLGDDPTVQILEDRVAELLGMASGLFLPSGTMGNLIGLLVSASAGDEVIVDADSHVVVAEGGGASAIGGVQLRPIPTASGVVTAAQLSLAVRPPGLGRPSSRLLWIENTHNRHGGRVWPLTDLDGVTSAAKAAGLRIHVDGARLFNAAIALSVSPARLTRDADTVAVCLSKGLGCPAGSILAGSNELIGQARDWRRRLGGAMRQSGLLAAAGLYAIDHHVDRLIDDHLLARELGALLEDIPGLHCDPAQIETNIVIVDVEPAIDPYQLVKTCRDYGVAIGLRDDRRLRLVTHLGVGRSEIGLVIAALRRAIDDIRAETSRQLEGSGPFQRGATV